MSQTASSAEQLTIICSQERRVRHTGVARLVKSYLALTKPKIAALITFTALVGTFLATPSFPPWSALIWGTLGIALSCACAATLNQVFDSRIDASMSRTRGRPLPRGQVSHRNALAFAAVLGVAGMVIQTLGVNVLTAVLTFASLIGYSVVYTVWLKHATSQNIVIGGLAGAAPPVLGWAAVTNDIAPQALVLLLIIFLWTPPHFWALAIARRDEYARANIPMLPVTFGVNYTRRQILFYTILLVLATILPVLVRMSGIIYLASAFVLDGMFLGYAVRLNQRNGEALAMRTFKFSVKYLMWLFAALLTDHYFMFPI